MNAGTPTKGLTVKKLIALLQRLDPNTEILLSCDGEGNRFAPLADVSSERAVPPKERDRAGDVELVSSDGEGEGGVPVLVLWPWG